MAPRPFLQPPPYLLQIFTLPTNWLNVDPPFLLQITSLPLPPAKNARPQCRSTHWLGRNWWVRGSCSWTWLRHGLVRWRFFFQDFLLLYRPSTIVSSKDIKFCSYTNQEDGNVPCPDHGVARGSTVVHEGGYNVIHERVLSMKEFTMLSMNTELDGQHREHHADPANRCRVGDTGLQLATQHKDGSGDEDTHLAALPLCPQPLLLRVSSTSRWSYFIFLHHVRIQVL